MGKRQKYKFKGQKLSDGSFMVSHPVPSADNIWRYASKESAEAGTKLRFKREVDWI